MYMYVFRCTSEYNILCTYVHTTVYYVLHIIMIHNNNSDLLLLVVYLNAIDKKNAATHLIRTKMFVWRAHMHDLSVVCCYIARDGHGVHVGYSIIRPRALVYIGGGMVW